MSAGMRIANKDRFFLNIAERIAADLVPFAGAKVASILVVKNDMIAMGYNQPKTHPFAARWGKNEDSIYFHAEVNSIYNALKRYSEEELMRMKTTLYVCRVKHPPSKAGEYVWGLSKPCRGCMKAIDHFQINRVVYTMDGHNTNEKNYGELIF